MGTVRSAAGIGAGISAAMAVLDCAPARPGPPVAVGAYVLDRSAPVLGLAPFAVAPMENFATMVGARPAIFLWYVKWGRDAFPAGDADRVVAFGATPMITWESCLPPQICQEQAGAADYANRRIVAGDFDAYLRGWARGAKAWGKPFFLRLNHEMNGDWYPWSTAPGNPNGNTPADYVAAWRHVHAILDEEGATNARWVWSPNVGLPLAPSYPGDAWVDWVALDGYNWGLLHATWTPFEELFAASYTELDALTAKPMMIAETASTEEGGDKAQWIHEGFLDVLPRRFPRVRAVVWWNANTAKDTDWRVSSSHASLAAWRGVVSDPYFRGAPPLP